jgi:hypothetical protein
LLTRFLRPATKDRHFFLAHNWRENCLTNVLHPSFG